MKGYLITTLSIVLLAGLTACTSTPGPQNDVEKTDAIKTDEELRQVLAQKYEKLSQALEDSNVARIANEFFTEGAKLIHPNGQIDSGRTKIQNFFGGIAQKPVELKTVPVDVENYCEAAYVWGKYSLFDKKGKQVDQGNYVAIWKKEDGNWKMWRDITIASPEK